MLRELVTIAVQSIFKRKLRSFLTLLGVIIGVAAIVGMIGAVQGISTMITGEIEKFQSDIITVLPGELKFGLELFGDFGATKAVKLTEKDVDEIKKISGVKVAGGIISKRLTVEFNEEKMSISVTGIDPDVFKEVEALGIKEGRYFDPNDGHVVVIGYSVANELFDKNVELKKVMSIEGKDFRVIGILDKAGGIFRVVDTMIYIPKDVMESDFSTDEGFTEIDVKIEKGADAGRIASEIEERLINLHKVKPDEKDFTIITPEFTRQITGQITMLMQVLIGGVAGISLVVGAIGISNMMFTAVLERTREIGIMKALGATSRNIMTLFLIESGIIGIAGGIIGILFGYGLGEGFIIARQFLISRTEFATGAAMPHMLLTPQLIFGVLVFSFVVGIASGFLPAYRASRLQPVEALRYE